MAGTPENARVWSDGDVYVSFDDSPTIPADIDTDFGIEWDVVGLVDGDSGFPETASTSLSEFSSWGLGVIMEKEKDFKITRTFTAQESVTANETVRALAYPTSSGDGLGFGPAVPCWIAFELRGSGDDADTKARFISTRKVRVRRTGSTNQSEAGLETVQFEVTALPDEDGQHWTLQATDFTGS